MTVMAREDYGRIVYSMKPKEKIKFKINTLPAPPDIMCMLLSWGSLGVSDSQGDLLLPQVLKTSTEIKIEKFRRLLERSNLMRRKRGQPRTKRKSRDGRGTKKVNCKTNYRKREKEWAERVTCGSICHEDETKKKSEVSRGQKQRSRLQII